MQNTLPLFFRADTRELFSFHESDSLKRDSEVILEVDPLDVGMDWNGEKEVQDGLTRANLMQQPVAGRRESV